METKERNMKKWVIAGWLALGAWGLAGTAAAQAPMEDAEFSDEELIEEGLVAKEEPFDVQLGLNWRAYLFEHSALQRRADRDTNGSDDWRDGDTDGNGWGVVLSVARGTSKIKSTLLFSDYDYSRGGDDFLHRVETERRDFELEWNEIGGRTDRANWGWILGLRYSGLDNDLRIEERPAKKKAAVYDDQGATVEWLMAEAGYFGAIQPFRQPFMNIHGNVKLLIGEAEGTARSGSDNAIDGVISETWDDEYSVAYGLNGTFGVSFRIRDTVGLAVEYTREWLYSFDATDTGIVVFPDNNDALFIESWHGVMAHVTVVW
jgi:hypothetical protein